MADSIEKVTGKLEQLRQKAAEIQRELSSGNWGSVQIVELSAALEKITTSIAKLESKRLKLLDAESVREFNSLARAIETLQSRAMEMGGTRSILPTEGAAEFNNTLGESLRKLANLERAIKSFESRKWKQFTPEGKRKDRDYYWSIDDLPLDKLSPPRTDAQAGTASRIQGARLADTGRPLPNIAAEEQSFREAQKRTQIRKRIETDAAESLKEALRIPEQIFVDLDQEFKKAGESFRQEAAKQKADSARRAAEAQREADIRGGHPENVGVDAAAEAERILNERAAAEEAAAKKKADDAAAEKQRKQDERERKKNQAEKDRADRKARRDRADAKREEREAERERKKAEREAEEAERRRLESERVKYSTENLTSSGRLAASYGFAPTDLKEVLRSGKGELHQSTYKRVDDRGVSQNLKVIEDKYGNVSPQIPRNMQSFTQGIVRDMRELAKWSIAIGVIYGPLNKLSEMFTEMVENESKLADATVAVTGVLADQGKIFDEVYRSAQSAGEDVSGVIDAFNQAYRAAGRLSDEGARFSLSVKLMNDSLVLSKLSTLDQASAIDTLTAALYQSNKPLDDGKELLDEWVKVSRLANVDLATLATGVAVLGDSAETAGLSLEDLNAMIATIAETSLAGGKEAANIAKALIGNYQSDTAVKELNRLGISVTSTTGKTREFLDVMSQVYNLRQAGAISNDEFSRLTLALGGGGVRRQKDVSAFLENLPRMQQLVSLQNGSEGEAANALAKKLDTLQTATTRFENSLQSLMQSLGDEGGLLDLLKNITNAGTVLIEIFDKLTAVLGKAAPLLYTVGIASLLTRNTGGLAGLAGKIGGEVGGLFPGASYGIAGGAIGPATKTGAYGQSIVGPAITAALQNKKFLSLLGVGSIVGGNVANNDWEEAAGAAIGGAIGFALTGGNPIGATVGAAMADSFVKTTITYESTLADFFADVTSSKGGASSTNRNESLATPELIEEAFRKSSGPLFDFLTSASPLATGVNSNTAGAEGFMNIVKLELGKFFGWTSKNVSNLFAGTNYETTEAYVLDALRKQGEKGDEDAKKVYEEMKMRYAEAGKTPDGSLSPLGRDIQALRTPETVQFLEDISAKKREELLGQLVSGDIKPTDYTNRVDKIAAFSTQATTFMAAFGDEFMNVSESIDTTSEAYEAFLVLLSSGSEEQLNYLNAIIADYDALTLILENWAPERKTAMTPFGELTYDQVLARKEELGSTFGSSAYNMYLGAQLQNKPTPGIVSLTGDGEPINNQVLNTLLEASGKEQRAFLESPGGGNLTADEIEEYQKRLEKFSILVEQGGKTFYRIIEGVDQKFLTSTYKDFTDEGKIAPQGGVGIQQMNATQAQYNLALSQYDTFKMKLESLGYDSKEETQIVKLSDSDYFSDRKDFKLIQLLLGQIADNTEQKIDGMFNLPEGAAFYVNLAAAKMHTDTVNNMNNGVTQEGVNVDMSKMYSAADSALLGAALMSLPIDKLMEKKDIGEKNTINSVLESVPFSPKDTHPIEGAGGSVANDYIGGIVEAFKQLLGMSAKQPELSSAMGKDINAVFSSFTGKQGASATESAQPISTKLDLNIESTTQLLVDGRMLALVIKPYLYSDLLQAQQSQSTLVRRFVI